MKPGNYKIIGSRNNSRNTQRYMNQTYSQNRSNSMCQEVPTYKNAQIKLQPKKENLFDTIIDSDLQYQQNPQKSSEMKQREYRKQQYLMRNVQSSIENRHTSSPRNQNTDHFLQLKQKQNPKLFGNSQFSQIRSKPKHTISQNTPTNIYDSQFLNEDAEFQKFLQKDSKQPNKQYQNDSSPDIQNSTQQQQNEKQLTDLKKQQLQQWKTNAENYQPNFLKPIGNLKNPEKSWQDQQILKLQNEAQSQIKDNFYELCCNQFKNHQQQKIQQHQLFLKENAQNQASVKKNNNHTNIGITSPINQQQQQQQLLQKQQQYQEPKIEKINFDDPIWEKKRKIQEFSKQTIIQKQLKQQLSLQVTPNNNNNNATSNKKTKSNTLRTLTTQTQQSNTAKQKGQQNVQTQVKQNKQFANESYKKQLQSHATPIELVYAKKIQAEMSKKDSNSEKIAELEYKQKLQEKKQQNQELDDNNNIVKQGQNFQNQYYQKNQFQSQNSNNLTLNLTNNNNINNNETENNNNTLKNQINSNNNKNQIGFSEGDVSSIAQQTNYMFNINNNQKQNNKQQQQQQQQSQNISKHSEIFRNSVQQGFYEIFENQRPSTQQQNGKGQQFVQFENKNFQNNFDQNARKPYTSQNNQRKNYKNSQQKQELNNKNADIISNNLIQQQLIQQPSNTYNQNQTKNKQSAIDYNKLTKGERLRQVMEMFNRLQQESVEFMINNIDVEERVRGASLYKKELMAQGEQILLLVFLQSFDILKHNDEEIVRRILLGLDLNFSDMYDIQNTITISHLIGFHRILIHRDSAISETIKFIEKFFGFQQKKDSSRITVRQMRVIIDKLCKNANSSQKQKDQLIQQFEKSQIISQTDEYVEQNKFRFAFQTFQINVYDLIDLICNNNLI